MCISYKHRSGTRMTVDYTNYTAEELLHDAYFIESMRHPTLESTSFWEKLVEEKQLSKDEFDFARQYLTAVTAKKDPLSDVELRVLHKRIMGDTTERVRRKRRFYFTAAAAALLILAFPIVYLLVPADRSDLADAVRSIQKPSVSEQVELILSDNERIAIDEDSVLINYASADSIRINKRFIGKENSRKEETARLYNQLLVPYGKFSKLILEDGSSVWVNAGTRVVYPVHFENNKREIYVDGEIYVEVARDEKRPFYVRTSGLDVAVLGTSFNLMAYEKDSVQSVVLVNGAVEVNNKEERKPYKLRPEQMLVKQNGEISVRQVNVEDYISWRECVYTFRQEKLQQILLRLSRYYDIEITADERAARLVCNGKLELKDNYGEVLRILSSTAPVDCLNKGERKYHFMFNPLK